MGFISSELKRHIWKSCSLYSQVFPFKARPWLSSGRHSLPDSTNLCQMIILQQTGWKNIIESPITISQTFSCFSLFSRRRVTLSDQHGPKFKTLHTFQHLVILQFLVCVKSNHPLSEVATQGLNPPNNRSAYFPQHFLNGFQYYRFFFYSILSLSVYRKAA